MPSYRYTKDIKQEELKAEKQAEYSKKQKAANWWHYHWGWVAAGILLLGGLIYFVVSTVTKPVPDFTFGIVTPSPLPDALVYVLEEQLAQTVGDLNDDGQTLVTVEVFTVTSVSGDSSIVDPYNQMAGITRLSGAFQVGDPVIFAVEPQQASSLQQDYQLFGRWGHAPSAGTSVQQLTAAWKDIPVLSSLNLQFEALDGQQLNGQEILADYRIGLHTTAQNGGQHWQQRLEAAKRIYENWVTA